METAARRAVIGCTLAGATLAFVGTGVVGSEFDGSRSQTAHAAFETLIGLVALVAAFLVFSRLQVTASRRDVWLVAALGLFGFSYVAFAVLPPTFPNGYPQGLGLWGHAIGTVVAAGALAIAGVYRPLRIRVPRVWAALALGSCVLGVTAVAVILHVQLPQLTADATEPTEAALVFRALQLLKAVFFAIAAVGFLRHASRAGDLLSSWFAVASSVACTAAVALAVSPRVDSDWVHIGDVLRFAATLLLLCGVVSELRRGQEASRLTARLEERRRVAYDLHDGLAQDLAYIATQVDSLAELPEEQAAALRDAAQRALTESREAIALLAEGDRPLEPALMEAAEAVATREGIALELRLEPPGRDLADREAVRGTGTSRPRDQGGDVSEPEDRSIAMSHVSLTDRRCPDCGERIFNPGAHLERCVGPRAHGKCDCPVGYMHLPDCEVTGDETA